MDQQRRKLILGGTAALFMHSSGAEVIRPAKGDGRPRLSLAALGGVPGASPERLVDAFEQAFAHLKLAGGGELLVPPGVYDFGECGTGGRVVSVDGLNDVVISAYGATFRLNTTRKVIPILFYFYNPNNVTFAGASFNDVGYDADVDWRGMYCAKAESNRACSGFRMVDCKVDGAVGLFQSLQHGPNRYLMKDIHLHGTVRNAYYGAGLTYVGDNAKVDFVCENVRRGCIAYGLRNATIRIKMTHEAGMPGSNGFVSLACEGENAGNVENVRIDLDVSGVARHSGLVHFYHQKGEARGWMRNIRANVTINNLKKSRGSTSVFLFDHELPDAEIVKSTARGWDQIFLSGRIVGEFAGRIVYNPSVSTAEGMIYIDPALGAQMDTSRLARNFRVKAI
jgi:hypothetical protein